MAHSIEDFCYVGHCPVCDESVDESDAGYCHECGGSFHWGDCGTWFANNHTCNNCIDALSIGEAME